MTVLQGMKLSYNMLEPAQFVNMLREAANGWCRVNSIDGAMDKK